MPWDYCTRGLLYLRGQHFARQGPRGSRKTEPKKQGIKELAKIRLFIDIRSVRRLEV